MDVFVYLMKSEYDSCLKWPLCADVAVEFVNWKEDRMHHRGELPLYW